MRIKWRGLELPSKIHADQRFRSPTYGKFFIEPFERGFGTTVGNSIRRTLLSSIEGAAVTSIKIKGAPHEFTSLPGVMEDVTDIVLNVKSLIVKLDSDEPKLIKLHARGPGEVTADMIESDASSAPSPTRSTSRWSSASPRAAATSRPSSRSPRRSSRTSA